MGLVVMAPNAGRQFKTIFSEAQQQLYKVFGMTLTELPQKEKITISQKRGSLVSVFDSTVVVFSANFIDQICCSCATFAKRHQLLRHKCLHSNLYASRRLPHPRNSDPFSHPFYFRRVSIYRFLHICHLRDIPLAAGHDT